LCKAEVEIVLLEEVGEYNMSKNLVIFHAAKLLNPDIPHKTKVVIKL